MTDIGKFNPNSVIKDYVRGLGLNETSNVDRHIILADIRAALGSEKFSEWYNEVYKFRSVGKHAEYEQAIKAMFGELSLAAHPKPEDGRTDSAKCICVDILNSNPDPVLNPDCPLHGAMWKADNRLEAERDLDEWQAETQATRESDRPL